MDKEFFFNMHATDPMDRVDGRAKVTGSAAYAADHKMQNTVYGFLMGSTIAKGRIKSIDTKSAERAPRVLAVITHLFLRPVLFQVSMKPRLKTNYDIQHLFYPINQEHENSGYRR